MSVVRNTEITASSEKSFESAINRLGGKVIGFSDASNTLGITRNGYINLLIHNLIKRENE